MLFAKVKILNLWRDINRFSIPYFMNSKPFWILGINCETCEEFYYRPAHLSQNDTSPCQPCQSSIDGVITNPVTSLIGDCVINNDNTTSLQLNNQLQVMVGQCRQSSPGSDIVNRQKLGSIVDWVGNNNRLKLFLCIHISYPGIHVFGKTVMYPGLLGIELTLTHIVWLFTPDLYLRMLPESWRLLL